MTPDHVAERLATIEADARHIKGAVETVAEGINEIKASCSTIAAIVAAYEERFRSAEGRLNTLEKDVAGLWGRMWAVAVGIILALASGIIGLARSVFAGGK
jgi:hypothetical protein